MKFVFPVFLANMVFFYVEHWREEGRRGGAEKEKKLLIEKIFLRLQIRLQTIIICFRYPSRDLKL